MNFSARSRSPTVDLFLKDPVSADKSTSEEPIETGERLIAPTESVLPEIGDEETRLREMYSGWARFVWLTLQRLGVRTADLDDLCQDVFIVVQRRIRDFDPTAKTQPWLFAICAKVAANYRRRAYVRLERPEGGLSTDDELSLEAPHSAQPDQALERLQSFALIEMALSQLSPVKRAVFIMFELEGLSCQAIADELGLPVGTVYSRLHNARAHILEQLTRRTRPTRGASHD